MSALTMESPWALMLEVAWVLMKVMLMAGRMALMKAVMMDWTWALTTELAWVLTWALK